MPFPDMDEAEKRLSHPEPLTAEDARALFRWLGPLHHHLPRIQMDLALQQIEAVDRFNKASGRLTKLGMWLVGLQTFAALVALAISVISLLHK